MKINFTHPILKTLLLLTAPVFLITGCHTPEDLREIGPQQKPQQESNTEPQNLMLIKSESLRQKSGTGNSEVEVVVFGNQVVHLKTPFQPSVEKELQDCEDC